MSRRSKGAEMYHNVKMEMNDGRNCYSCKRTECQVDGRNMIHCYVNGKILREFNVEFLQQAVVWSQTVCRGGITSL